MNKTLTITALALLVTGIAVADNFPKEIAYDKNKDGRPDRWEYFTGQDLTKIEIDANQDGKLDEIIYAKNGVVTQSEKDTDFDGLMDQWLKY